MTYQPKGSMCAACLHKHQDCSHLPFDKMMPISKSTDLGCVIVRCTEFKEKQSSENWPRADPKELAKFDPSTKKCTMNCGPHSDDPRSREERKFLCTDCENV